MKIFNVCVQVEIRQISDLPDQEEENAPEPEKKTFSDDPIDKAEGMLKRFASQVAPSMGLYPGQYPGQADGTSLTQNVRISAESFEELQAVLSKFNAVLIKLPAVPDSIALRRPPC